MTQQQQANYGIEDGRVIVGLPNEAIEHQPCSAHCGEKKAPIKGRLLCHA
jgi:hypothetical protein